MDGASPVAQLEWLLEEVQTQQRDVEWQSFLQELEVDNSHMGRHLTSLSHYGRSG